MAESDGVVIVVTLYEPGRRPVTILLVDDERLADRYSTGADEVRVASARKRRPA